MLTIWYDTIRKMSLTWTLSDHFSLAHIARKKYQKEKTKKQMPVPMVSNHINLCSPLSLSCTFLSQEHCALWHPASSRHW